MSKEAIIEKILSDAEDEATSIVRAAREQAESTVAAANARAEREHAEAEAEANARKQRILEGKAAAARLDSAKILLAEKRRVLGEIYARALARLLALGRRESLELLSRVLEENAEAGDVVVLAENFPYADGVAALPVMKERGLTLSGAREKLSGGCVLRGKVCDKDLSYAALLEADMEENQAETAAKLFGNSW